VHVPRNITERLLTGVSLVVTWPEVSATDVVSGGLEATCVPASGSRFLRGTTTVTCSATDAAGLTGRGRFTVRVAAGIQGHPSCEQAEESGQQGKKATKGRGEKSRNEKPDPKGCDDDGDKRSKKKKKRAVSGR
jgi:hypothetical protein